MQSILLIKTSSLGDVVHNLPVVNDIRNALPEASIDWVVEKPFAAIPSLHPAVRRVIACELRRWRRSWFTHETRGQWRRFIEQLRAQDYDAIIDTQGLLKSAVVACAARGVRFGLDWRSSREPLRLFYDRTFRVPWSAHAVERNRALCGLALGYPVTGEPDYGVRCEPATEAWLPRGPFVVLLHSTSQARKLWPEERWIMLGQRLSRAGYGFALPWGGEAEQQRAQRLAASIPGAIVPPRLGVGDLARVIAASVCALGVDTGLTHLAAAIGVPVVGIYGATDPRATGIRTSGPAVNVGSGERFPAVDEVIEALERLGVGVLPEGTGQST